MSPMVGMILGTRPERYSRVPNSRALMGGMKPGPRRKVQLRPVTSA